MGSVCPSDRSDYLKAAGAFIYINVSGEGGREALRWGMGSYTGGPVPGEMEASTNWSEGWGSQGEGKSHWYSGKSEHASTPVLPAASLCKCPLFQLPSSEGGQLPLRPSATLHWISSRGAFTSPPAGHACPPHNLPLA